MGHPTGEPESGAIRLDFDRRLMVQFLGSVVRQGSDQLDGCLAGRSPPPPCGSSFTRSPTNLGNFLRTLTTPEPITEWSLTSKLIKIGAKVVRHGRHVIFQMAEVAVLRELFHEILRLIAELRPQPPPAPA
jgi:hypothetical protein